MQGTSEGFGQLSVVGLITAGVMLVAGLCLVEPSVAAWLAAAGYQLTGAFLIVQAAVLGMLSLPGEGEPSRLVTQVLLSTVARLVGFACAMLDLVLVGAGALEGGYVALLLTLPCALLFAQYFSGISSNDTNDDDEIADEGKIIVTPDEGKPDPIGTLRSNAWSSIHTGVLTAVMLAIMVPGIFLYRLLHRELIEGQAVGLDGFASAVSALSGPWIWVGIALCVVVPIVLLIFGAGSSLSQWLILNRHARSTRQLTGEETAFVERAYASLHQYATARGYERWSFAAFLGIVVLLIACVLAFAWYGRTWYRAASAVYAPPNVDPSAWQFVQPGSPGSMLTGVFFAAAGTWALHHIICQLSPRYAEFMTWSSRTTETDGLTLRQTLVRAVRVGRVRAGMTFSPAVFLQQVSRWNARYAYVFAAFTGLPTMVLLERDLRNYELFTDTYVEVVEYWSGNPRRVPYRSIIQVNLECVLKSRGEIDLEYEIELPDDRSIDLIKQVDLPERLADFERIDSNLAAAGVRFSFNTRRPMGKLEFTAFSEECLDELTSDYDAPTARRVKTLLHLDAFRARETAK